MAGHACFKITLKCGKSLLIDPFDETVGYGRIDEQADIALVTHEHFDHSFLPGIRGAYRLIDKAGSYSEDGVEITGTALYHDEQQGRLRGQVIVYTIRAEGIRVMHMGDIGDMPPDGFFETEGKADVLMIPVGGVYTVDAGGALKIINRLRPNITIPMHYMTEASRIRLNNVHEFITLAGKEYDISRLGGSSLEISADTLKKRQRICIMDYSN